jgi:hypothetical protein
MNKLYFNIQIGFRIKVETVLLLHILPLAENKEHSDFTRFKYNTCRPVTKKTHTPSI